MRTGRASDLKNRAIVAKNDSTRYRILKLTIQARNRLTLCITEQESRHSGQNVQLKGRRAAHRTDQLAIGLISARHHLPAYHTPAQNSRPWTKWRSVAVQLS